MEKKNFFDGKPKMTKISGFENFKITKIGQISLFWRKQLFGHIWFQNERCGSFPKLVVRAGTPPLWHLTLKVHNFFSFCPLLRLEKYVTLPSPLCLFSTKKFQFVCFPWNFPKNRHFSFNYPYIAGKQTNFKIFFENEKFGVQRCLFIPQVL